METSEQQTQKKYSVYRHYARVMAFAVVAVILGVIVGYAVLQPAQTPTEVAQEAVTTPTSTSTAFARSAPMHLRIPTVDIDVAFEEPLGLNDDQTIEVPDSYWKVGWYKNGATPGEVGTAVVLGHVDSYEGPAIFWPLGKLEPGDLIEVDRADGTTAVFKVLELERVSQNNFPTEKVYAHTDYPSLRLITCTGIYSHGAQRYSHNLIVYAALVDGESEV